MNRINRRKALAALGAGSALLLGGAAATSATDSRARRTQMGIVTYAMGLHQKYKWAGRYPGLAPALALLEEAHRLGAAGIQVEIDPHDPAQATELRRRAESYEMYLEATVSPPKSGEDVTRFEEAIRAAQTAGATLARTTIMPGRRYEDFKSLEAFRQAQSAGEQCLQRAEPVLARHRFRFAVENHKDQRIAEKLAMLERLGSEYIGLCVDVGNSFTLMEDPLEVARAYAPYAFTVHFKDQAVREAPEGFWFADVPLGQGFIDLAAVVNVLRAAKPDLHLNLEVITRDPLSVPILEPAFWETMPDTPARQLAGVLRIVKVQSAPKPFPRVSKLSQRAQLTLEQRYVTESLAYARDHLGLV